MCPLWPIHILFLYLVILFPLLLASFGAIGLAAETISFGETVCHPEKSIQLKEAQVQQVSFIQNDTLWQHNQNEVSFYFTVVDPNIAFVEPDLVTLEPPRNNNTSTYELLVNVTGKFLGCTSVCAIPLNSNETKIPTEPVPNCISISVSRTPIAIDKAFTYSVAVLVSIIYINMGAALDMRIIQETIRKPYGPAIGFFSQFLIMPLLAYGIAKLLIPVPALQLGLFITGCSPGGGASNIWTLALGGNLDLSITMTTISTIAAFAMMPFWILTLGCTIFAEANLTVPFGKIATFAIGLLIPLGIGIGIQFKWPKVAKFLVRILKPFAAFLIVFIVAFAVYTNMYLFKLFNWQIILSGMMLPWLGYLFGGGAAWLLKQDWRDVLAIGIETGLQNTGLAIFALRFSLPQPEADLTTVIPVAVAMMTPVLPAVLLLYQKICGKRKSVRKEGFKKDDIEQGKNNECISNTSQQSESLISPCKS